MGLIWESRNIINTTREAGVFTKLHLNINKIYKKSIIMIYCLGLWVIPLSVLSVIPCVCLSRDPRQRHKINQSFSEQMRSMRILWLVTFPSPTFSI